MIVWFTSLTAFPFDEKDLGLNPALWKLSLLVDFFLFILLFQELRMQTKDAVAILLDIDISINYKIYVITYEVQ